MTPREPGAAAAGQAATAGQVARATYAAIGMPEDQRWELTATAVIDWWHSERDLEPPQAIAVAAAAQPADVTAELDRLRGLFALQTEQLRDAYADNKGMGDRIEELEEKLEAIAAAAAAQPAPGARRLSRHADHDPSLICRPAGNGLCETWTVTQPQPVAEAPELGTAWRLLDEARAERDDYAARLKAVDQSWTMLSTDRDKLRDGIGQLLAGITASAGATRPSKKTSIEDEIAAQLRQLLEGE